MGWNFIYQFSLLPHFLLTFVAPFLFILTIIIVLKHQFSLSDCAVVAGYLSSRTSIAHYIRRVSINCFLFPLLQKFFPFHRSHR